MSKALDNRQIGRKALIVLVGFFTSGALGLLRIGVVGAQFGTGAALDVFSAAQQLPETVFVLVAGGALGSSFIPVYARLREADEAAAWRLASAVLTLSACAAALFSLLVAVFAPQLVGFVLWRGRSAQQQQLMVDMIRLMMLTPAIFSVSGLVMAILQAHHAFWLPALAVSMNNIGIIFGALVIAPNLPAHADVGQVGELNVMGLAVGAVLSAALHLLVQLPGLLAIRSRLRLSFAARLPGVVDVLRLMGPRVLGLAVVQINFYVNIVLANSMVEGSFAALRFAFMLCFFALGMIGQSQAAAVFPSLAALRAAGDYIGFKDRLSQAMRNVLFLSFPAAALLIVLGEPLVSVLQRGEWTLESTRAVAWALSFYALGLAGFALLEVLSRAFYALEDTWTPVLAGLAAMLGNIALSLALVQLIGDPTQLAGGAFAGLALANALTTLVEALALWWLMRRRLAEAGSSPDMHDRVIIRSAAGSLLLSLTMALAVLALTRALALDGLPMALLGCGLAALVFLGIGAWLDVSETRALLSPVSGYMRRIRR
ncbi:MAG: murein biosynthesis integral membrane protein MurJ [Chloroflexi bacterium]|nr:murein biosynthesis integral membrane protein MurJ [Chloroflexota bacterium]MCY4246085.1 murein biosynthesis integral membrane protein MurJ [Chloroflexota bacterium]